MPTEAVLNQLSSRKVTESLMMQIILHCAPVLKDVKMSSMFTVPAAYLRFVRSAFRGTGIRVKCLCQGAGRAVVYVYREAEVQQCLEDPQVAVFLQQYGYESTQAEACLNHLGARVSLSAQGMEHYPHEMGIFLGYLSATIELSQLIFMRGLFEWDDMIHNGLGYMAGCLFTNFFVKNRVKH